jgi:hypothetical protein
MCLFERLSRFRQSVDFNEMVVMENAEVRQFQTEEGPLPIAVPWAVFQCLGRRFALTTKGPTFGLSPLLYRQSCTSSSRLGRARVCCFLSEIGVIHSFRCIVFDRVFSDG